MFFLPAVYLVSQAQRLDKAADHVPRKCSIKLGRIKHGRVWNVIEQWHNVCVSVCVCM